MLGCAHVNTADKMTLQRKGPIPGADSHVGACAQVSLVLHAFETLKNPTAFLRTWATEKTPKGKSSLPKWEKLNMFRC
ncbi:hypothetical protein E5288_WYG009248 [Bos mutus]|uniref:Uncharacterized protein n=1 Tax=Bos mutus TaxID=72004 RepID=A0A6B0SDY6_9CETA|nr:hypothetical protein [Bos mutus]